MLSIGALGGNPGQSTTDSDRSSGSMTSSANSTIPQQSLRGADRLTQSLRNYMITSPEDEYIAIAAQVFRQPGHFALTAIV
jgi:hypothetical protein